MQPQNLLAATNRNCRWAKFCARRAFSDTAFVNHCRKRAVAATGVARGRPDMTVGATNSTRTGQNSLSAIPLYPINIDNCSSMWSETIVLSENGLQKALSKAATRMPPTGYGRVVFAGTLSFVRPCLRRLDDVNGGLRRDRVTFAGTLAFARPPSPFGRMGG